MGNPKVKTPPQLGLVSFPFNQAGSPVTIVSVWVFPVLNRQRIYLCSTVHSTRTRAVYPLRITVLVVATSTGKLNFSDYSWFIKILCVF